MLRFVTFITNEHDGDDGDDDDDDDDDDDLAASNRPEPALFCGRLDVTPQILYSQHY